MILLNDIVYFHFSQVDVIYVIGWQNRRNNNIYVVNEDNEGRDFLLKKWDILYKKSTDHFDRLSYSFGIIIAISEMEFDYDIAMAIKFPHYILY